MYDERHSQHIPIALPDHFLQPCDRTILIRGDSNHDLETYAALFCTSSQAVQVSWA